MIVVTREQAHLRPPTRPLGRMGKVKGIVVHCTQGSRPATQAAARKAWNNTQWGHQAPPRWVEKEGADGVVRRRNIGGNGWPDIAYQRAFNDLGIVLEGRPDTATGAHTIGKNTEALGFVWQGRAHETPTQAAYDALAWLIEQADQQHGCGLYVIGHRDVSSKSCPGDALYAWITKHYRERNPYLVAA